LSDKIKYAQLRLNLKNKNTLSRMTKTSTSTNTANAPIANPVEKAIDEADQADMLFYQSITPQLNELIKNPSDSTIEKILAYSKKK
jgi:hypothetical protein